MIHYDYGNDNDKEESPPSFSYSKTLNILT